jgi:two-component system CheB/CheR fusion protein
MAFVLVQHLSPDHQSLLVELLGRHTHLLVLQATDGVVVQPDCVYVIPPDRDMALVDGALRLLEPVLPRGQRLPIDFFFRSLAASLHERAIAVVLSGTGHDGTQGLRAIKGEGGLVLAQTPAGAEFDGMPRSAIDTGLVDLVLAPADMPAQLRKWTQRASGTPSRPEASPAAEEAGLSKLFLLLRLQTGHDFSQYKLGTVQRRVERRMAVNHLDDIADYVKLAQKSPAEVIALFRDLLISVTSFFRDPDVFTVLETRVLPKLLAAKGSGASVRVWCAGCSTGEEAYSLAILLSERQEQLRQNFKVKVFATDIDAQAIATARAGVYPASIAADVSPERLARYFTRENGGASYRVHKSLRDMLVFSEQDVIKDPPFSRLDLVSCRNLLIYLSGELQKKLMPLFHYALNPKGALLLGTSESVGEFSDLFHAVDRKLKVYLTRADRVRRTPQAVPRPPARALPADAAPVAGKADPARLPLRKLTEQALLEHLGGAAAVVDAQGDLLYLHGRAGQYLEPALGEVKVSNLLTMARAGLRQSLTAALHRAVTDQAVARRADLRVKTEHGTVALDLTVRPLSHHAPDVPLYLVVFDKSVAPLREKVTARPPRGANARITELTRELQAKEEYLQASLEAQETTNEELKSSNEEMQSVNEELQSANEELETSKEELQSVNEELATVNGELQAKVSELSRSNNDMANLLAGTGVATVFVGHALDILRFTPAATQVMNFIPTDVGRPIGHIVSNLVGYDCLVDDVRQVLDTLAAREVEVQTRTGAWFLLRIRPYRTIENVIEGAVITFVDITELRRLQQSQREGKK